MLLILENVLDADRLQNARKILANAPFKDGKLSAGKAASRIKHNLEMDQQSQQAGYLDQLVVSALAERPDFRSAALPYRVSQPFFARYGKGMAYGDHIDDPVMGSGQFYRCDVACTVFLSEPDEYEGGELVVNTTFGRKEVKLRAGDAVLYPASSLHHVAEVSEGERVVCVLWIQSMVRDPARRELLYELDQAREKLLATAADSEESALVNRSYNNLVRMWADV